MPGGRPKGSNGTPESRRVAARLRDDLPGYHPVLLMAEGAIALAEDARKDRSLWPEAVAANDRVAAYIVPKLRAIEHSGSIATGAEATEALRKLNEDAGL